MLKAMPKLRAAERDAQDFLQTGAAKGAGHPCGSISVSSGRRGYEAMMAFNNHDRVPALRRYRDGPLPASRAGLRGDEQAAKELVQTVGVRRVNTVKDARSCVRTIRTTRWPMRGEVHA